MEIHLQHGAAEELEVDLLALGVRPEGASCRPLERLDALINGAVKRELELRGFDGRANTQVSLPTYGAIRPRNLLLYGMGAEPEDESFRLLAAATIAGTRAIRGRSAAIAAESGADAGQRLQALAEGAALAAYRFGRVQEQQRRNPAGRDRSRERRSRCRRGAGDRSGSADGGGYQLRARPYQYARRRSDAGIPGQCCP